MRRPVRADDLARASLTRIDAVPSVIVTLPMQW